MEENYAMEVMLEAAGSEVSRPVVSCSPVDVKPPPVGGGGGRRKGGGRRGSSMEEEEFLSMLHGSDPVKIELNRLENELRGDDHCSLSLCLLFFVSLSFWFCGY